MFDDDVQQIEKSATDAAVFLTVYPVDGFQTVTDDDFIALGKQILDCSSPSSRSIRRQS